jgi:hypothetical protein
MGIADPPTQQISTQTVPETYTKMASAGNLHSVFVDEIVLL